MKALNAISALSETSNSYEPESSRFCEEAIAAWNAGDSELAKVCVAKVAKAPTADLSTLDKALWLSDRLEVVDVGLDIVKKLVRLEPERALWSRNASGRLDASGRFDEAFPYAEAACRLEPGNKEYLVHAACVHMNLVNYSRAFTFLASAIKIDQSDPRLFKFMAFAVSRLGKPDIALKFARRAYEIHPRDIDLLLTYASMLCAADEWETAANLYAEASFLYEHNPIFWAGMGGVLSHIDRDEEALAAIDRALQYDDVNTDFQIHRSHVLIKLGRLSDAKMACDRALAIDPDNTVARRQRLEIKLRTQEYSLALADGVELLRTDPNSTDYRHCVRYILDKDFTNSVELDDIVRWKISGQFEPRSLPPLDLSFWVLAERKYKVIGALVLREIITRFTQSRFGYFWVLMEPLLHVGALAVAFRFTTHGKPPLGDSFFFFYFTGLIPYHMFVHTLERVTHSVSENKHLFMISSIKVEDLIIARGIVEFYTEAVVFVIFLIGFALFGIDPTPTDMGAILLSSIVAWALGLGFGCTNVAVHPYTLIWEKSWGIWSRAVYFASGIFYFPAMMPSWVRQALEWNPMLHVVDWFRTGFYPDHKPFWLDREYPVLFAIGIVTIGALMVTRSRKILRELT